MIEVGSKAPSFNLHKSKTETVNSDDLRGKNVVLAFFPAAFTGVCEKEVCALRDGIASLNDANAEVFGIRAHQWGADASAVRSSKLFFFVLGMDFSYNKVRFE